MSATITIRLTEERQALLREVRKHFQVEKNSDAIDLALKRALRDRESYDDRLNAVAGCIKTAVNENAVERIRNLRGNP